MQSKIYKTANLQTIYKEQQKKRILNYMYQYHTKEETLTVHCVYKLIQKLK